MGIRSFTLPAAISITACALLACTALKKESDGEGQQPAAADADGKKGGTDAAAPKQGANDKKVHAVGDKVALDGLTMWVSETRPCRYDNEQYNEGLKKKGQTVVGALVYFEGTAEDVDSRFSSAAFKVFDGEGITHRYTSVGGTDCQPHLRSARLDRGDKKKGWVGFRVPSSAKKITMEFEHTPPHRPGKSRPEPVEVDFKLKP